MSPAAWIWLIGIAPATLAGAVCMERERRESTDPFERAAILRPALDGVVIGICWPLVTAALLLFGALVAIAWMARSLRAALDGEQ